MTTWMYIYLHAQFNIKIYNIIGYHKPQYDNLMYFMFHFHIVSKQDQIYLLQSRPITSIFAWSNDEITREFDSPFTNDDVVMFYNVK